MLYEKHVRVEMLSQRPEIAPRGMSDDVQRLIEQRVGLGFWEMSPLGHGVRLSGRAARIMNLPAALESVPLEEFVGCFVPDDRKALSRALDEIADKMHGFEATLRLYFNGDIKVIEVFCDVVCDDRGSLTNIVGIMRDVTERVKAEAMSKGRAAILRVITKNIPASISVLDKGMKFLAVSDHWLKARQFDSSEEVLGKSFYDVVPDGFAHQYEHKRVLGGEVIRTNREIRQRKDGTTLIQPIIMCPWRTGEGDIGGLIVMLGQIGVSGDAEVPLPEAAVSAGLFELLDKVS